MKRGLQVELYKWTGTSLELCSPFVSSSTRLVTSLAIIKQQYMLVGNLRKGFAFLHIKEDKGLLNLVSRDFGCADASAVEFLLAGASLAFVQADMSGHLGVFKYQRDDKDGYEPPGIRAVPIGRFFAAHKVC
jgi:hypothetical protein